MIPCTMIPINYSYPATVHTSTWQDGIGSRYSTGAEAEGKFS